MIYLRIDDDLKKQLQEEAKQKGLTLSAYIRLIISERVK
jgi:antitoxin component of RelBE/YafQ-DinJ toxin-antitoxin module